MGEYECRRTLQGAAHRPQNRMERAPEGPSEKQKQLGVDIYGAATQQPAPSRSHSAAGGHTGRPGDPKRHSGHSAGRHSSAGGGASAAQQARGQLRPIILVPKAETALVTIHNAPKLLAVCIRSEPAQVLS